LSDVAGLGDEVVTAKGGLDGAADGTLVGCLLLEGESVGTLLGYCVGNVVDLERREVEAGDEVSEVTD